VIALTKCMAPEDLLHLPVDLVDRCFDKASQQHPARRWEYSLALEALGRWARSNKVLALDVGGAGSPFHFMLEDLGVQCEVVDPSINMTLRQWRGKHSTLTNGPMGQAVFCISVLEHIPLPELPQFTADLAQVVAPGGLLFITVDIWDRAPAEPDTAHFSNMRTHIYSLWSWRTLAREFQNKGFDLFEEQDWEYKGHQLYGSYSFASLALVKR
jgi:hypothetical protein